MADPRTERQRRPASVYGHGTEPDPRFSLANERTFLAWVRTSLALLAVGVALEAVEVPIEAGFRVAAAGVFVALALVAVAQAWFGWARTERAMRTTQPLPSSATGAVLAAGIVAAIVLIVLGYLAYGR